MSLTVKPLHKLFVAEVSGVDHSRPLDAATRDEIVAAMDRYAVCVFPNDPPLSDEQHLAFARAFGPLQRQSMQQMISGKGIRLSSDEFIDVSNLDETGGISAADDRRRAYGRGNLLWHSDVTFDRVRAVYSLLSARRIPPAGGDTEFADMRAAYDALPKAMKDKIEDLVVEHSVWYSRALGGMGDVTEAEKASRPPAHHRLVQINPRTFRRSLYLASHASHVVGWPVDEGRALLDELMEHATRPELVYRHAWRVGDVVMWDNLQTMHRATPFDDMTYPRDMRRVTVLEAAV